MLQDNKFHLLTQIPEGKQCLEHMSKYLAFTGGLIRGGLSNLAIKRIVNSCTVINACLQISSDDTEAVEHSGIQASTM